MFTDPKIGTDTPGPGEAVFALSFNRQPQLLMKTNNSKTNLHTHTYIHICMMYVYICIHMVKQHYSDFSGRRIRNKLCVGFITRSDGPDGFHKLREALS